VARPLRQGLAQGQTQADGGLAVFGHGRRQGALTDPGGRTSRTRLLPRVTHVISVPVPKSE
jgi:hypothetical protein